MTERKFKTPKCAYRVVDNHIETDGSVRNKVTGTSFGAVLGHSPWMSPFEASCRLLGLISEDISDKPAVRTGTLLEVPIIRYLDRTYDGSFYPDEELDICAPREGDHDKWPSDWEDDIFAGHIDGAVFKDDRTFILEIKTARDATGWIDGVPQHYFDQVALYNHFLVQEDTAFFGVGFVGTEDYDNPYEWEPSTSTVMLREVSIDTDEVAGWVDLVREWYADTIAKGKTMDYDPTNAKDVEIWTFLNSVAAPEEEVQDDIDRLADLEAKIKMHDSEIDHLRKEADSLKKGIKDNLTQNGIECMTSGSGRFMVTISTTTRKSIDEDAMVADGLDPAKYIKTSTSNVFKIKAKKD